MNSQPYDIFYKTRLVWHSILEKIKAEKHVFSRFSQPCAFSYMSKFACVTYILHHLAFLVCCRPAFFSIPGIGIQWQNGTKFHAFQHVLGALSYCQKCFKHQYSSYFIAFCLAFYCILSCVQRHISLHLAAKCTAFWC